jgi:hypothetical protein
MFKRACFLMVLTITLSSCQKLLDYYGYKDVEPSTGCQITRITEEYSSQSETDTTRFFYHDNGLPSAIKYERHNSEFNYVDSLTFYYAYDHLNRLVSETSENVYSRPLHYYAYEGNSRLPVRDTIRALYVTYVQDLEYDANGRIVKVTDRDFQFVIPEDNPGPHADQITRYYYDIRGNRQEHPSNTGYKGLIQYSDKPSLYILHPVWQLIHKNYSKNGVPFTGTFNEKGLPLTIDDKPIPNIQQFVKAVGPGRKIEYECDGSN